MTARRSFLATTALIAPIAAVAGCSSIQSLVNGAGSAAGQAAVAKLVSYVQSAVTGLETLLSTFGPLMTNALRSGAQDALNALSGAAVSIGNAVSSGAAASAAASTVSNIGSLIQSAVNAVIAGLQAIPGLGSGAVVAIGIAQEVAAFIPTITAFINSLTTPATVSAPLGVPAAVYTLGVMVR